jgi:flavorubredoxin
MYTNCKVVISRLWDRFLPHLVPGYADSMSHNRIISLPDRGETLPFGDSCIKALPAHFLHSVGNFSFYDPVSKILFSGDIGASVGAGSCKEPLQDFDKHVHNMSGFHKRYMNSNKACRHWVQMVRQLDISMIVPQHGCAFVGDEMIDRFLNWLDNLQCGIDLVSDQDYVIT